MNAVCAGGLVNHTSWNGQTHWKSLKNFSLSQTTPASWYTDTHIHSPKQGKPVYKGPALQKLILVRFLGPPLYTFPPLPFYPSIHPSTHSSIHPSIHIPICLFVHLSIHPPIHLSVCPSIPLFIHLSFCLSIYLYKEVQRIEKSLLGFVIYNKLYNLRYCWYYFARSWLK